MKIYTKRTLSTHFGSTVRHLKSMSISHYLIYAVMVSNSVSCSGADSVTIEEARSRLRRKAQGAIQVDYTKPLGKRPVLTQPLPPGLTCVDSRSCFTPQLFLIAEGQGSDQRVAELDAKSRLSARIKSEIKSVVTTTIREGEGIQSQASGEIKNEVKTHFKYGELILTYPLSKELYSEVGHTNIFKVLAVLDKRQYQNRVKADLRSKVQRVQDQVDHIQAEQELLTKEWPIIKLSLDRLAPELSEYRSIMGHSLDEAVKLQRGIQGLYREIDQLKAKTTFILEINRLPNTEASDLDLPIKSAITQAVRRQGLRILSPGDCLPQRFRLSVNHQTQDSVHPLTGSQQLTLHWSLSLSKCTSPSGVDSAQELITLELPSIKGIERYQASAQQSIGSTLKRVYKSLKPSDKKERFSKTQSMRRSSREKARQKRAHKLANELLKTVTEVVSLIVPR